ncbi:hypothetical protein AVEN_222797-1 [Araneus ventricosus]|uniref:Uncharacterized protein n=1 Tax=Araneus ventricosus TaxID=182803 RepID=A0A4Y2H0B0_ARAVE|nr:hypothetical protein AVEN_222797-1 [Araneus ventricosus]
MTVEHVLHGVLRIFYIKERKQLVNPLTDYPAISAGRKRSLRSAHATNSPPRYRDTPPHRRWVQRATPPLIYPPESETPLTFTAASHPHTRNLGGLVVRFRLRDRSVPESNSNSTEVPL